jgi:uncharacterized membrane protein YgcG
MKESEVQMVWSVRFILMLFLGLWAPSVFSDTAYTFETLPNPTVRDSYISNLDQVLSSTEEVAINQRLKSFEEQTSNEVVVGVQVAVVKEEVLSPEQ